MTRNSPKTSTRSPRDIAMKKTANTTTNDKSGKDTGAKTTDRKKASSTTPVKKIPAKKAAPRPAEIEPAQGAPPEAAASAPIESSAVPESTSAPAPDHPPAAVPVAPDSRDAAPSDEPAPATAAMVDDATHANTSVPGADRANTTRREKDDTRAQTATPSAGEPDSRLPPVGTILRRIDRHGQVKAACTIEADGFTYQGHKYKSLSAAAIAAAKDLGLTSTTQNGYAFWQLAKLAPRVTAKTSLDLETLERAWDRYRTRIEAAVRTAGTDDKVRLRELLAGHTTTLRELTTDPVITATTDTAEHV